MDVNELHTLWSHEEQIAHIHGWDFSHINNRYSEEDDLPWDYKQIIQSYRTNSSALLDIDTGGGEFLRSLGHPPENTFATEGYSPNVELCRNTLLPLGIHFHEMADYTQMPFPDCRFDFIINRHGNYNVPELWRTLKHGGLFITEQVGEDNDRDLVELLLPGTPKPFHGLNLQAQQSLFERCGFQVLSGEECFRPIRFFDIGALVWFAKIIEWEFPRFSVDRCFPQLLNAQRILDQTGFLEGTIHRYLLVARKP